MSVNARKQTLDKALKNAAAKGVASINRDQEIEFYTKGFNPTEMEEFAKFYSSLPNPKSYFKKDRQSLSSSSSSSSSSSTSSSSGNSEMSMFDKLQGLETPEIEIKSKKPEGSVVIKESLNLINLSTKNKLNDDQISKLGSDVLNKMSLDKQMSVFRFMMLKFGSYRLTSVDLLVSDFTSDKDNKVWTKDGIVKGIGNIQGQEMVEAAMYLDDFKAFLGPFVDGNKLGFWTNIAKINKVKEVFVNSLAALDVMRPEKINALNGQYLFIGQPINVALAYYHKRYKIAKFTLKYFKIQLKSVGKFFKLDGKCDKIDVKLAEGTNKISDLGDQMGPVLTSMLDTLGSLIKGSFIINPNAIKFCNNYTTDAGNINNHILTIFGDMIKLADDLRSDALINSTEKKLYNRYMKQAPSAINAERQKSIYSLMGGDASAITSDLLKSKDLRDNIMKSVKEADKPIRMNFQQMYEKTSKSSKDFKKVGIKAMYYLRRCCNSLYNNAYNTVNVSGTSKNDPYQSMIEDFSFEAQ